MLFFVCAMTVVIETSFFALFGYRTRDEMVITVCANVITNLLLNLYLVWFITERGAIIYLLECVVVLAEYAVYAFSFGQSRRLLLLTFAANCLSFVTGLLLF